MVHSRFGRKNLAAIGARLIRYKHRIAGIGGVIHHARAIRGPSWVYDVSDERSGLAAHQRHQAKLLHLSPGLTRCANHRPKSRSFAP